MAQNVQPSNRTLDLFLVKLAGRFSRYLPGQVIFAEGDPGQTMLLVLSGCVKVFRRSADGSRLNVIATREAGEFLGEMALVESGTRSATVEAEEACEVLEFSKQDFETAIQEYPEFATRVLRSLSQKLRESDDQRVRMLEETNRILQENNRELLGLNTFLDCIIDQTPSAVFLVTRRGDIFRHNRAAARMFGLETDDDERRVDDLFTDFSFADHREGIDRNWAGEATALHHDREFPAFLSFTALSGHPEGILYLLICQDISELQRMKQAQTDYEKFVLTQYTAAELVHGANRILFDIHGGVQRLMALISDEQRPAAMVELEEIENTLSRIIEYGEDFVLNRAAASDFQFVDIRALIKSTMKICGSRRRFQDINLKYNISPDFPHQFLLKGGQIQSVLISILANAAESAAVLKRRDSKDIVIDLSRSDDEEAAVIRISDNGPARTPDGLLEQISSPGRLPRSDIRLGLATMQSIMESHGGSLSYDTSGERGVAYELHLPLRQHGDHG